MTTLLLAALAFFALHRLVSAGPMRQQLVALLGERGFGLLFSIASILCLGWLWVGYQGARNGGWNEALFDPPKLIVILQWPVQLIALVLIVAGLTTRNPTTSGMSDSIMDPNVVRGFVRISRHPFLWGIALMSIGHMVVSPTLSTWAFFGTLVVLAITGTFSIDQKRRRALGQEWTWFANATSNVPFMAIIQGRQQLRGVELGWWRLLIALVCFAALVWFHSPLFGRAIVGG